VTTREFNSRQEEFVLEKMDVGESVLAQNTSIYEWDRSALGCRGCETGFAE
jgi:hypothetical protein